MEGRPTDFWGKLELRVEVVVAWHPLVDHCADVAACAEALLQHSLLRRRLARLAGLDDLHPVTVARLCVLAALHDLGKFNQHFQNKGRPGAFPREGHVRELVPLFNDTSESPAFFKALLSSLPLDTWSEEGAVIPLLLAAVAHHGRPIPCESPGVSHDPQRWKTRENLDPFEGMRDLSKKVSRWFPEALNSGPPLPSQPEFQHGFAGLVMLADWLGSDRADDRFVFSSNISDDRITFARERARAAIFENGIVIGDLARSLKATIDYGCFTDITSPHDTQAQMLSLPLAEENTLTLLESETGSGKTEAALAHFFRLFQQGAVEGLYFALPTRTAATQIFRRVTDAVSRMFKGCPAPPPVVLAVPGYLAFDAMHGEKLPDFKVLWKDDSNSTSINQCDRHRGWAAEHPKRYLAAAIAVGTIDQCLLSALMTDHAHLRATTLLRSLLVVDEVHASDTYMTRLLRHVLDFHLRAGGHALLMSATLGSCARDAYLGSVTTPYGLAREEPYPRITLRQRSQPITTLAPQRGSVKRVETSTVEDIDEPEAVARKALDAAERGARVLVLRNTVRACVETQMALEALAPASEISSA